VLLNCSASLRSFSDPLGTDPDDLNDQHTTV